MIAMLDEYKTQLSDVCGYADQTVENYASCMGMFARYLREHGNIPIARAQGTHICLWIAQLKQKGFSYSRMEHHRSALKTFYAMLVKHFRCCFKNNIMSLSVIERSSSCLFTLDTFQLCITFVLTARFLKNNRYHPVHFFVVC